MINCYLVADKFLVETSFTLDSLTIATLENSFLLLQKQLQSFASDPSFATQMQLAFGSSASLPPTVRIDTDQLQAKWQIGDLTDFPSVQIVSGNDLRGAYGAYQLDKNRIYLSEAFLVANRGNLEAVAAVLLEEYGHSLDGVLNSIDAPGDEGAIFSALVRKEILETLILQALKTEDDTAIITFNGENIQVERADITGTTGDNSLNGTIANDLISGLEGNDSLYGNGGNDTLKGGAGEDILYGTSITLAGKGEIDNLEGGIGTDIFILGDVSWIAYDDGNNTNAGENNYANIIDLAANQDYIQLQGSSSQYKLVTVGSDTKLYLDKPQSEPDELIAILRNVTGLNLNSQPFFYKSSPRLSINDITIIEGNSGTKNATFTVTLNEWIGSPVTVQYSTANGSAIAGSDYTTTSGTINFSPSITTLPGTQLTQTITVPILGNTTAEGNETFFVNLSNATNAIIADSQGQGTIRDDDTTPTIRINDIAVSEGNSGSSEAIFTVSLSQLSSLPITVQYSTANGTAIAGSDYTAKSGTITFNPGQTIQNLRIPIVRDTVIEPNETFFVNLLSPSNATIADNQGQVTIRDDDNLTGNTADDNAVAIPGVIVNDVTVTEGDSGTTDAIFSVSLTQVTTQTVTVQYSTINGTANAGEDYNSTSGTVTFIPGQTTQLVKVPIIGDTKREPDETFFLNLTNAVNAIIVDSKGKGIIQDRDLPTLSINDVTVTEKSFTSTEAVFTVTLSEAITETVTVEYSTRSGSATSSNDYSREIDTLTFRPGETTQTITVNVRGDTIDESDENFFVDIFDATNATIADAEGEGTIKNTKVPSLSINDVSVEEGDKGTTDAVFTVTLSQASTQIVTVEYTTLANTATYGSDYLYGSGELIFNSGQTTQTLTIPIVGDTLTEQNEIFFVQLSNYPSKATIADGQGQATIVDNNDKGDMPIDGVPTVSISDAVVTEGDNAEANFTISASGFSSSSGSIYVDWYIEDLTAKGGFTANTSDYQFNFDSILLSPSQPSTTIKVQILNDEIDENIEQFKVVLKSDIDQTYTLSDSEGIGTITDNDAPPVISIIKDRDAITQSWISEPFASFKIKLSKPSGKEVKVKYKTTDADVTNKATAGNDYQKITEESVTFAPGETEKTVRVQVNNDAPLGQDRRHQLFEILARDVAYREWWNQGDSLDQKYQGIYDYQNQALKTTFDYYVNKEFEDPQTSFYALGLTSDEQFSVNIFNPVNATLDSNQNNQTATATILDEDREPILAIRGTLEAWDIYTDINPDGVGFDQFNDSNRTQLLSWLTEQSDDRKPSLLSSPSITGHSLGGALAQLFGADFLSSSRDNSVKELVTFNSPGITKLLWNNPFEPSQYIPLSSLIDPSSFIIPRAKATHYITSGDIVSMAGEEYFPGNYVLSTYISNNLDLRRKHLAPVITDYIEVFSIGKKPDFSETPHEGNTDELSSPFFGYNIYSNDPDYLSLQLVIDAIPTVGPKIAAAMQFRDSTEIARRLLGNLGRTLIDIYLAEGLMNKLFAIGNGILQTGNIIGDGIIQGANIIGGIISDLSRQALGYVGIDIGDESGNNNNTFLSSNLNTYSLSNSPSNSYSNFWTAAAEWPLEAWNAMNQWQQKSYIFPLIAGFAPIEFSIPAGWTIMSEWQPEAWQATTKWSPATWTATTQWTPEMWTSTTKWSAQQWNSPFFMVSQPTISEGNTGTKNLVFTVSLSTSSNEAITVNYTTVDDTAKVGTDYTAKSGTLTFAPGQTSRQVAVAILGDTLAESEETFKLQLSNPSKAFLGHGIGVATILDNDNTQSNPGKIQFSSATYSLNEAQGTSPRLTSILTLPVVTVSRFGGSQGAVSVKLNFTGGTATAATLASSSSLIDYLKTPTEIKFADGETGSKQVFIGINNDLFPETSETINISLENPTGGVTLGVINTAIITIIDDETSSIDGDDTLAGGTDNDSLSGGAGNDTINGGAGNDTLIGGTGNDIMRGEVGNDAMSGGDGNDAISGGDGNDRIRGDAGNDTIDGGNGIDTIVESGNFSFVLTNTSLTGNGTDSFLRIEKVELTGGIGNNTLNASAFTLGTVTLNGGSGNDTLIGGTGNDILRGEVGNDAMSGGDGNDAISGGDGNDRIRGDAGNDTIDGGNGIDTLVESGNFSFILTNSNLTGNGSDSLIRIEQAELTGGIGNNTINASAFTLGTVTLNGGSGNDTLIGGTGNDILRGEVGNDALAGGDGNDAISGGDGNDRIRGNSGNDTIDGGNGIDTFAETGDFNYILTNTNLTGNGTDSFLRIEKVELTGGISNNTLNASAFTLGSVTLNGADGNDALTSGSGNDILTGGNGNDTLVGGLGNDTLTGGLGSDRFTFNSSNQGIDSITDFSVFDDTITVSAAGFGGGLVANAAITAAQFVISANATNASQRFIYSSTTGGLFFDVDGSGLTAQVQIATLSTGLAMTNTDIFVIS